MAYLKKENTKLRIKLELQQEEITAQNKIFARAIAYNFSKNIEINHDIKTIKKNEFEQKNEISYIMNLIEEIKIWKNEWIDWFGHTEPVEWCESSNWSNYYTLKEL